jgi:hypothetical protein
MSKPQRISGSQAELIRERYLPHIDSEELCSLMRYDYSKIGRNLCRNLTQTYIHCWLSRGHTGQCISFCIWIKDSHTIIRWEDK